ncbi:AAA ATPase central domain protein [Oscillochloris trichoides DG-6]|uniref:AAA ATPase central domain protein n=1 Tax=Oscillochloris trichoides DG-6 TaxID=765420 RepID=E1IEY0_9CHLR|nr:ATP-binding protein [Oscillochloris trichoides]EFO80277.1 AAA ATPase central domain protein [Oscillochloris trichoides DG-6]
MYELRLDFAEHKTAALIEAGRTPTLHLRDFLQRFPARAAAPIPPAWLDLPLRSFRLIPVSLGPLAVQAFSAQPQPAPVPPKPVAVPAYSPHAFPATLTDSEAVARAYATEIGKIGRYLSNDLSVLVVCDKVLAEYIYRHAVAQSNKRPLLESDTESSDQVLLQRDMLTPAVRIAGLSRLLAGIKSDQVLVLRHLDTLAGSGEGALSTDARMLTEVLYRSQESIPTLLGFIDPSLGLPKVLIDRFAVRVELAGLSRDAIPYLLTRAERERFAHFEAETLFKNVSGYNAIQLRNVMRYLLANSQPATPTPRLMALIREFKRGSGDDVEIPDVTFADIGGYEEVKAELFEAIELITGKRPPFSLEGEAEENLLPVVETDAERTRRRKLAPRGFIFHGPPGTGKTLFAKAIANAMNATIQVVSGPEIMDMWVGKSESNLRRLFSIARRNAPAVIFFDEFDSIATQRSGLGEGGNRASNAVVAQLLSEIDGFRPDQDLLVIGTTNRLDIIDEALLRPSRLQPIHIALPDQATRRKIAAIHARGFEAPLLSPDLFDLIAAQSEGFNGDEIRAIFQEIARQIRRGVTITTEVYTQQIEAIRRRRR